MTDQLNSIPSDEETASILRRIQAARAAATSPVDLKAFDAAEKEAKELYQERADRAEWLSLADRVSNALVRIGAANAGLKSNVDMSKIDYGPQTDWEGRINRYGKEYSTELGRLKDQRGSAIQNQRDEFGLGEKAFDMASREKAALATAKRAADAQASQDARQDKALAAQDGWRRADLEFRESKETDRQAATRKWQEEQNAAAQQKLDIKDVDASLTAAGKQHRALQQLVNQLQTDKDLGSKNRDKLAAQYGKLASEAGVDLDELQTNLNATETLKPAWLGGKSADDEKKEKSSYLKTFLDSSKEKLDALAERKNSLLQKKSTPAPAASAAPATPAPATTMVRVLYKGKTLDIPKADLKKALEDGAELVK